MNEESSKQLINNANTLKYLARVLHAVQQRIVITYTNRVASNRQTVPAFVTVVKENST